MTTINEGADAARDEIDEFVEEMLELLADAGDRGKEDLAGLRSRLQGRAQSLKESALKGQADLRAAAESAAIRADDYAHENPWQVAAAAGAAGIVLGMLLSRD